MRARRFDHAIWAVIALALCASACGSRGRNGAGPFGSGKAGETGGSVNGMSGSSGASGGGAPDAYRATIFATQTILCPGQCTSLTASAENGHPPYVFAWQSAVGDGAGPHEVCPEVGTTYGVTVSDTAVEGEFGQPSQSTTAAITIQILDASACELDGGVPIDPPKQRELCSITMPYEDPGGYPVLPVLGAGNALATDTEGNLYFAGQYTAALDLGDGLNAIEPTPSAFIAKYSPDCEPLWIKRYVSDGQSIRFSSIASGPNGELAIVGSLVGNTSFDGITTDSTEDIVSALMISFDPSDGTAQRVSHPGNANEGSGLEQLEFNGFGDAVISGWIGAVATFEGEALDNDEPGALLARISLDGTVKFAHAFSGSEAITNIAVGATDAIAFTSLRSGVQLAYDGTEIDIPFFHRFAALLGPAGALQWFHDVDEELNPMTTPGIGLIDFDSAGNVLVSHGNFLVLDPRQEEPELMTRLAPDGSSLGTRVVAPPGAYPNQMLKSRFAVDPLDNIIHLTTIANATDTPVDAGVSGGEDMPSDAVVQKLAPDASLIWRHRFDTDVLEMVWGLTVAPDGSIWIGHGQDANAEPFSGTLRITKLAP